MLESSHSTQKIQKRKEIIWSHWFLKKRSAEDPQCYHWSGSHESMDQRPADSQHISHNTFVCLSRLTDLQPCIFYWNTEFGISRSIQNCQKTGLSWLYLSKLFFAETVEQAVQQCQEIMPRCHLGAIQTFPFSLS